MAKLTKIVATIGPSSDSEEMIKRFILSGVNVLRFNLKHNTLDWHKERILRARKIALELDIPIGILADLQGPEIRIIVPNEEIAIKEGDILKIGNIQEGEKGFGVSHPEILNYLKEGMYVVADDGKFEFVVDENKDNNWYIVSASEGVLKTRKTLNIPDSYFPLDVLTDRDIEAISMAREVSVDFVALSFVREGKDITILKEKMKELSYDAKIIAKIETRMALDNLDEIVASSDGVMVARGDLGVEMPFEEVPFYQKMIIKKCLERGIPVITATQMLRSMTENQYPTRAEISDVANAVYDFTDATMLSEETASGKYPVKAVEAMARTTAFIEQRTIGDLRAMFNYHIADQEEMMCDTAYNLYLQFMKKNIEIGGFIAFTSFGRTPRKLSRYRGKVPIYAFTYKEQTRNILTLNFGVIPILKPDIFKQGKDITDEDILLAVNYLKEKEFYEHKKHYIVLHGDVWMVEGRTSTIKVLPPEIS